jgi:hypothetical protein
MCVLKKLQSFLQKYNFSKNDAASDLPQLCFFPVTVQQSYPFCGYARHSSYLFFGQLLYFQQVMAKIFFKIP